MFSKSNSSDNGEAVLGLIRQLDAKILRYVVQHKEEKYDSFEQFRHIVLTELLKYLRFDKKQKENPAKKLDLFCTANAIFNTILSAKNRLSFEEKITTFFRDREEVLRGDSHDYCYSDSLANQLCDWLVRNTFPDASPTNMLLQNAMTKDRLSPWQDPYTMDDELPDSAGDFFRTSSNQIHLYHGVIECAIFELKSGRRKKTDIWLATDRQYVESKEAPGNEQKATAGWALSADDLDILKQRAPAIKDLVDYTELLEDSINLLEKDIFTRFDELYIGLRNGITSQEYAKSSSHIAIAEFCKWWNRLNKLTQQRIRGINDELNDFINQIVEKRDYCTDLASRALARILNSRQVRSAFYLLDKKVDPRISDSELDKRKEQIFAELALRSEIHVKQDIFAELCRSHCFITWCCSTELFDYGILKILASIALSDKVSRRIYSEKCAMVSDIFSINDDYKLLTLKDFLSISQTAEANIFYYAVLVKLQERHLLRPRQVKMLTSSYLVSSRNELLYYAVLSNNTNQVIELLALGANPIESADQHQHLFMDVGYECDVRAKRNHHWYKATVLERKGALVHINYKGWSNIFNEWIDITVSAERFSMYGTCSINRPFVSIFPVIKDKYSLLFDVAFQNKQVEIALALSDTRNVDGFSQQHILLTAKTEEEWSFVLRYLNGLQQHFFQPAFLQDLLEHSIQQCRSEMISVLASLGAKLRPKHIECVYRGSQCHLLTAKMVEAEPSLREIVHKMLLASQTKQQWDFAKSYITQFEIGDFDELFLQALMQQAVKTFSIEMIKFFVDYGLAFTLQDLKLAFQYRSVEAIKTFLSVNRQFANETLLLSEVDQKNWVGVLAYIEVVELSEQAFCHLVSSAIYQEGGSWAYLRHFLDVKKTQDSALNIDAVFDFKEKRQCAIEFFSYFIQKSTCPYRIVEMMNSISQMEEKSPLIMERIGHSSGLRGYQWNKKDVSHAWVKLVDDAKAKIIDLAKKSKQSFNQDDDEVILSFLNNPTVRWRAAFYQSTSSCEQYVRIKEGWVGEMKEELRPTMNPSSTISPA